MAMNIPGELVWVLDILGYEWPPLDEDEIRRAAAMTRTFREDLEGTIGIADARINGDVTAALTARTAAAYTTAWNENRSTNMQQLVDLLDPAATGIDLVADAVVALKVKVIAELVITAAQIAAAAATAVVTLGMSAAANAAIIVLRKKALDIATDLAVEAVAGQVLSMLVEPLTGTAESLIAGMLDAPLVQGAVGDVSEYRADFAALEAAAGDIESNGGEQRQLGEQYVQQIMSLQIITG